MRSLKFQQDIFFDFEELTKIHSYEIGFQIKENPIPQSQGESVSLSAVYQSIIEPFSNKDYPRLKVELEKFGDYLYTNNVTAENVEEFDRLQFGQLLIELSEGINPAISQNAFHIITLLQSKGPAYPAIFFSLDFLDFCVKFINKPFSAVCYYAFVATTNISSQSENLFYNVLERIPIDSINPQRFLDSNIKEAALDLACTYVKYNVDFQIASQVIEYAKQCLSTEELYFHHSAFWIFVRLLRFTPDESIDYIMIPDVLNHVNDIFEHEDSYSLIPGLIFISYVYELNFEVPNFYYKGIIDVLADTEDSLCRKQSLRTISKMSYRNNSLIPHFIKYGLIMAIQSAIEKGQYKDKLEIGFTACNIFDQNIAEVTNRVLATHSIGLFLTLIDFDDEELNKHALFCMYNVFQEAENIGRVDELMEPFIANDGMITIEKLQHEEDNETASCAANFEERFLRQSEEDRDEDVI